MSSIPVTRLIRCSNSPQQSTDVLSTFSKIYPQSSRFFWIKYFFVSLLIEPARALGKAAHEYKATTDFRSDGSNKRPPKKLFSKKTDQSPGLEWKNAPKGSKQVFLLSAKVLLRAVLTQAVLRYFAVFCVCFV